ncbi:MAG: ATP-binding cassette domain-containing protein [Colwellia sp.]|jgi:ABC-2 type transport system ATP-binding protein|nr:ATP-binding cassette domain-containing protein [Colwellia sp.]
MGIVTNDLSFAYGKKTALNKVNLTLPAGFNVLLGPNGAGKSTLLSLLTGLTQTVHGTITINDNDLSKHKSTIMSQMGVVFQQSTLDLDLSVKQNLLYYASLHGIAPKKALNHIDIILAQLSLTERLHDKVRTLNGGHRRRVEIARALIHQPKVLLLDEATVGLDVDSRLLIISYVRNLCAQRDICVLWTTHLMDEVEPSDRLIVINKGEIQAQDQSSKLCKQYKVADVYQLYFALIHNTEVV